MDRLLRRHGFVLLRQTGSHARHAHADGRKTVVSRHGRDIDPGLVAKILKDAGLGPDGIRR